MDEQTLNMMVALGAIPEEQALLMRQRNTGAELMATPSAEGRQVGRTYVASSPLEHLSVGLMRAMGARKMQQSEQSFRDTLRQQTAGRGAYANALLEAMRQRNQPPEPVQAPWDATEGRYGPGF